MATKTHKNQRISSKEDEPAMRVLRQRELVENYKNENEVTRLDLTRESRDARKAASSGAAQDISRLQEEGNRYIRKIESERKKIEELDLEIANYQAKILEQKSRMGGVNAAQENNKLVLKQIKVLENSLDKNLTKFNETIAKNRELRSKVDQFRRERVVFDVIYKKLERELHEKKMEMAAIIEDSKNAYQARDKSLNEMASLQQRADKERTEFEIEFKELSEMIKQQEANIEQLRLKQFDRNPDSQVLAIKDSVSERNDTSLTHGGWVSTKQDKSAPLSQEKMHSYEDSLQTIMNGTGVYNVNELVTKFLEAEEQNFSLFNYVNDVNTEIERLEHSISDMRNQIEKYRGQGMSTDTQRKKTLRDLEDKLTRTDKKANEYETKYTNAIRTITQLKNGIQSIFTRIGAASTSVDEMLGTQGVTESNMMQYLGIIEQRTIEILQAYAQSQLGLSNEHNLQLPSVVLANSASRVDVKPPTYEDIGSDEDSQGEEQDERPLTRQELQKRTVKDFSKRATST